MDLHYSRNWGHQLQIHRNNSRSSFSFFMVPCLLPSLLYCLLPSLSCFFLPSLPCYLCLLPSLPCPSVSIFTAPVV